MDNENELDLELEGNDEEKLTRAQTRNKNLSEKVKLTATERDEATKKAEEAEAKAQAALKDVDFFKNFNSLSAKYEGANEYQDKIREKVMAGYEIEDATVAVLNKEGKFIAPPPPASPRENPAGGSANNTTSGGEKNLADMTKDEKFAKLQEAGMEGELRKVLKL